MKKVQAQAKTLEKIIAPTAATVTIGKIARVDKSGRIYVDYPGNPAGPAKARITASVQKILASKSDPAGSEVLLAFENNDPGRPIIVDAMYSLLGDIMEQADDAVAAKAGKLEEALVDGKRVVLSAEEEVVLKCGSASITLTKSGKVLISGDYVSSRSKGANKIKGGSIQLN